MFLYQIVASTYIKKYKKVIQKNKFKLSAPVWNEKLELADGSYSVSDI